MSDESDGEMFDNNLNRSEPKPKLMGSDSDEPIDIDSEASDESVVVKKKEAPTKRKLGPKVVSSPESSPIKSKQKRKKGLTSDDDTPVKKVQSF